MFGLLGTSPVPYVGEGQTTATTASSLFGSLGCGFLGLWPVPVPYVGEGQPRTSCRGFLSSPQPDYAPAPPTPSLPAPTPTAPTPTTGGAGGGGSRGNAGRVPR